MDVFVLLYLFLSLSTDHLPHLQWPLSSCACSSWLFLCCPVHPSCLRSTFSGSKREFETFHQRPGIQTPPSGLFPLKTKEWGEVCFVTRGQTAEVPPARLLWAGCRGPHGSSHGGSIRRQFHYQPKNVTHLPSSSKPTCIFQQQQYLILSKKIHNSSAFHLSAPTGQTRTVMAVLFKSTPEHPLPLRSRWWMPPCPAQPSPWNPRAHSHLPSRFVRVPLQNPLGMVWSPRLPFGACLRRHRSHRGGLPLRLPAPHSWGSWAGKGRSLFPFTREIFILDCRAWVLAMEFPRRQEEHSTSSPPHRVHTCSLTVPSVSSMTCLFIDPWPELFTSHGPSSWSKSQRELLSLHINLICLKKPVNKGHISRMDNAPSPGSCPTPTPVPGAGQGSRWWPWNPASSSPCQAHVWHESSASHFQTLSNCFLHVTL